jgi:hypothetical protein
MRIRNILLLLLAAAGGATRQLAEATTIQNTSFDANHDHFAGQFNLQLKNPYRKPISDIDSIPAPKTVKECDAVEPIIPEKIIIDGGIGEKITVTPPNTFNCLRQISEPDPKHFDKATQDAARALLQNNQQKFSAILSAWPKAQRKELHNKAVTLAQKNGYKKTTPYSEHGAPEDEIGVIKTQPHHKYPMGYSPNFIESKNEEEGPRAPTLHTPTYKAG